MTKYNKKLF